MQVYYRRCLLLFAVALISAGLQAQDEERGIKADEFIKARPVDTAHKTGVAQPTYKAVGKPIAVKAGTGDTRQIGMTIWRLRPSRKSDTGARIIVQEPAAQMEWTPERISISTPLKIGERIRFSFETAQKGYLYVIDREKYSDGSLGEPTLIFPTTRLRSGENAISPGQLIEIPDQGDQPNFFTLQRSRPDQRGEELILLVTPEPLPQVTVTDKAQGLPQDKVVEWEKRWGNSAQQLELVGGAGRPWTRAEQQAGKDQARLLTQSDPGPQTVYRVSASPNHPILVRIQLRYSGSSGPSRK